MSPTAIVLLVLSAAAVATGAVTVWRRPAAALAVFAVGFALHNLVLLLLVGSGAPTLGIRVVQAWKEGYVALLGIRLARQVLLSGGAAYLRGRLAAWSSLARVPKVLDAVAIAFAMLLVAYLLVPSSMLPAPSPTLGQRVLDFRTLVLLPALYVCGRVWPPTAVRDRRAMLGTVAAVGALVTIVGLIELWFIPTKAWYDAGIYRLDLFEGYRYVGPGGLPENFFQSTTTGLGLRRMVSTYLSPLGIAYTGLLMAPVALVGALASTRRARWWWAAFALIVIGISLSVTRLALGCLAVEAVALAVLLRRRVVLLAAALTLLAAAAALLVYPNVGPVLDYNLNAVRPTWGGYLLGYDISPYDPLSPVYDGTPPVVFDDLSADLVARISSGEDASIQAHLAALPEGTNFVLDHPLGLGLGASMPRLGGATGPRESAVLAIGGELGLLGLVLFVVLYAGVFLAGGYLIWIHRRDLRQAPLAVVLGVASLALGPIVVTSQLWGDPSVTYPFWWIAGACIAAWPARGASLQQIGPA